MDDGTAPAKQIEGVVLDKITKLLTDPARIMEIANLHNLSPHQASILDTRESELNEGLRAKNPETQRTALIDLVQRIHINPKQITLTLRRNVLINAHRENGNPDDAVVSIRYPLEIRRRGVEMKLIVGGQVLGEPDQELIKLVATSRSWYLDLKTGAHPTIGSIARKEEIDVGDVSRALKLAFLSPSIIRDFIHGKHPVDLTVEQLRRMSADMPLDWKAQRAFLGMPS